MPAAVHARATRTHARMSSVSAAVHKEFETRLALSVKSLETTTRAVLCEELVSPQEAAEIRKLRALIRRLLDSPRHVMLRRAGSGPFVRFEVLQGETWRVFSGLRPMMKRRFFPTLSDEEQFAYPSKTTTTTAAARQRTLHVAPTRRVQLSGVKPPPRAETNAAFCSGYGAEHGALVHRQLQLIVDSLLHGYRSPIDSHEVIDPCVGAIIATIQKYEWLPFAAELGVFDAEHRVATQADLVVYDRLAKAIRVVELTFGYESVDFENALSPDDLFEAPLDFVPNSPAQRKLLQVYMTAEIIRRNYGIANVQRALVRVRPCDHKVDVYTEKDVPWWSEAAALRRAYDTLSQRAE